jgi:hypothetical protein
MNRRCTRGRTLDDGERSFGMSLKSARTTMKLDPLLRFRRLPRCWESCLGEFELKFPDHLVIRDVPQTLAGNRVDILTDKADRPIP